MNTSMSSRTGLRLAMMVSLLVGASCSDSSSSTDGGGGRSGSGGTSAVGGHGGTAGVIGSGGSGGGSGGSSLGGMGGTGAHGGNGGGGSAGGGGATGAGGLATLSDGQIIGVMLEANNGEVRTADVATARSESSDVQTFAVAIRTDHDAASMRLNDIVQSSNITAADSLQRQMVSAQTADVTDMLWMESIAGFDVAFAQDQITLHTSVLKLLDDTLIPQATNAALRTELGTERAAVMIHLAHAQLLLLGLTGAGGNGGAGGGRGGAGGGIGGAAGGAGGSAGGAGGSAGTSAGIL
jgi:predicted outer membrane protein